MRRSELIKCLPFRPTQPRAKQVGAPGGFGGRDTCPAPRENRVSGRISLKFLIDPGMRGVRRDHPKPLDLSVGDPLDDLIVGQQWLTRDSLLVDIEDAGDFRAIARVIRKSWPPSRLVVLEKSRDPIALHWPVMELAPVPGRPMLPVISARLMMACAVRVASWPWLTPIVHQNETRCPRAMVLANSSNCSGAADRSPSHTRSGVNGATNSANSSKPVGMRVDEIAIDRTARDEQMRQSVKQHQIGFRLDGIMLRRGHRGLGFARVDDDDFGPVSGCASRAAT